MIQSFNDIPKIFDSNIRIQILSSLYVSPFTYSSLKDLCHCSDGKLAGHIKILLKENYITQTKEFVDNKPRTTYTITDFGKKQLEDYIHFLKNII